MSILLLKDQVLEDIQKSASAIASPFIETVVIKEGNFFAEIGAGHVHVHKGQQVLAISSPQELDELMKVLKKVKEQFNPALKG